MKLLSVHRKLITNNGDVDLSILSDIEYSVLLLLVNEYPRVLSRESILEQCWVGKIVTDNSINVAISNVRSCLGKYGLSGLIVTERGVGYKISEKITIAEAEQTINNNWLTSLEKLIKDNHSVHWYYMLFANILAFTSVVFVLSVYIQAIFL